MGLFSDHWKFNVRWKVEILFSRWDCDPIWSSALWFSLLLALFLIAILSWAIEMLATLQTPSKFDDPKGKPLVVPLTD
jgi:Vacuolar ATP synthase subunit S1 (ATP6S1)